MEYGSFFDAGANASFQKENSGFLRPDWRLYRSGRDALKALARISGRCRVLLPALCCASMIVPFTLNGFEPVFYRLHSNLTGDEADVRRKIRDADLLLYMPYFGIRPFSDAFLQELRERGVLLAEDRTQDIIVLREESGFVPDATVASLRKWAFLPEGGMLQTELGTCPAQENPYFGDLCRETMKEKYLYLKDEKPERKQRFLPAFHAAEELLDVDAEPVLMSAAYREIAAGVDFRAVYNARRDNLLHLKMRLAPLRDAGILDFLSEIAEESLLYFPVVLKERSEVQQAMAERNIYCPVIWPAPAEVKNVCPISRKVTQHMLAIPVDQRYGRHEMDFFAECLTEILHNMENRKHEHRSASV